jgi:hypothetical protein
MRFRSRLRRCWVVGLAISVCSLALVLPATASQPQDLRSPDSRDAALAAAEQPTGTDLRSPDARDAATTPQVAAVVDLRSPDARDAALAVTNGKASTAVAPVQTTVLPVVNHGSQTLAIVFSSTALFLALVALGFVALYRRPRPRWTAS